MNNGKEAPKERKLAIVGFADSRNLAPYDDPSWEIWGVNDVYAHVPRVDVVFEVHHLLNLGNRRNPNHETFLRSGQKPVWLIEDKPEYPSSKRLPVEDVIKRFPRAYLTNSIAWMLALAIMDVEGSAPWIDRNEPAPGRISVFGVDMAHCVAPETRVLTADLRWVSASSLKVGDEVMAFDEHVTGVGRRRQWRKAIVEEAHELMRPCYRLYMSDGSKLVASAEHRWLTQRGHGQWWTTTEGLKISKKRKSRIVKPIEPWDEDMSHGAGYLAAAFDGEGSLSMPNPETGSAMRLVFTQRDNIMSDRVLQDLHARGFEFTRYQTKPGVFQHVEHQRLDMLRFLGQIRPSRLLQGFDCGQLGAMMRGGSFPEVVEKEFIGEAPVIGLRTSTGTFIAEGFASHNSSEYGSQRPSCEYWVGIAEGLGIEVYIPDNSDLCKTTGLYGLHTTSPLRIKIQSREEHLRQAKVQFMQQQAQLQGQIQGIQSQIDQVRGQMAALEYIKGVWTHETDIPIGAEVPLKDRGLPMPGSPLDEGLTFPYQPFEAPQPNPVLEDLKEKTVG